MISPLGEQFQLRFPSCYDSGTDAPSLSMLTNLGRPPWARGCRSIVRTVHRRLVSTKNVFFKVSEEVQEAVRYKRPVVALETTIYTHGFPYPENVALASHLESVVRVNGGVPATIGVLNGVARVGFETEELIELTASAGKPETKKLSRRDLGYICGLAITGRKMNGGTTVAGTMMLAKLAGIKVFATGGLGGVHRNGESSMDISADLTELGRTSVAVVSSGCKSFLDIPRTLEYLETQGVCVGTFADGREGKVEFPAFWTRDSGIPSPLTIQDEKEAAAILYAQSALSISSGLLFANPVAIEHSIAKNKIDAIMAQAIREAEEQGASGSDNTPFVLRRIREVTGGQTVTANRALIETNVIRGTKVAVELAKLECRDQNITAR
ncbi:MAG: Pseudouridine-5 -phosphate glycosidase [Lasallia pustulata]|uniref:Pseudouridine-5-phosphate glycosidase n=1 Tax=Lasallia pustulata TaxID=136370 RepID=A0A5M8PUU4_9LECA|nr:MAG: Pseudouridine-5 -phosphate glycosidase [Lasallia pustulata]